MKQSKHHTACRSERLLVLVGLTAFLAATSASAATVTIIHAGWLLTVPGEPPGERQSIVVEGGRISDVVNGFLTATDVRPEGAQVRIVDLSSEFVVPGLIDSHVHLASSPNPESFGKALVLTEADMALLAARHARQTLQSGFTTVVDLGSVGVPGHENAIFAVRDAVNSGNLAGPRILAAGTPVAASGLGRAASYREEINDAIDSRSICDGVDDCRRAVRHQVKRGADIIVFFNTGSLLAENPVAVTMTDGEMQAIVETAHSLGRKVIADGHHAAGIAAALRAGADIIDSAHLYDDQTFSLFDDDVFLQSHIYGVVRAVGDTPQTLHAGLWGWLPTSLLERFQAIRLRPFAIIRGYESGIRNLAYASDAGVYPWGENARDMAEFVERGMLPVDAIKTATVNAARMLGLATEIGSIKPGMRADIIATAANPLDDILQLTRVRFVMRDGVVYKLNGAARAPFIAAAPAEFSP